MEKWQIIGRDKMVKYILCCDKCDEKIENDANNFLWVYDGYEIDDHSCRHIDKHKKINLCYEHLLKISQLLLDKLDKNVSRKLVEEYLK
jgi:hypothetical protein